MGIEPGSSRNAALTTEPSRQPHKLFKCSELSIYYYSPVKSTMTTKELCVLVRFLLSFQQLDLVQISYLQCKNECNTAVEISL